MSVERESDQEMRVQKFLSRAGVASRRQAEGMMAQGRVRVNGRRVVTPGSKVIPARDVVEVDGRRVRIDSIRWILLNKPAGLLTTRSDDRGRPTVYSRLDPADRSLRYVGRLDRDTEGLLLFTNEGDLIHSLLHPSGEVEREYRALVRGVPEPEALRRLEEGVELDDGRARAEDVRLDRRTPQGNSIVRLVLREGRKREVRRLLAAVGHPVGKLRRVRFGPLRLGRLGLGEWRPLRPEEIEALRRAVD
ncbi:MAG: pseudouridine synthase [Gemmatimonadota bacterium]